GTAKPDRTQWINDFGEDLGLLAFDADKNGKSGENGRELFGDRVDLGDGKKYEDGFAALRGFVERAVREKALPPESLQRGRLDASDIAALERGYGFKIKVGGFNAPAISLSKAGVTDLALSAAPVERAVGFDARGNDLSMQPGAVFKRADG